MSTYLFMGAKEDGSKINGSRNTRSKNELEEYLLSKKITPIDIFDSKTPYKENHFKNINPRELSIFCKQFSVIFSSFITLMEGIKMISEQASNKILTQALDEIFDFMEKGYTFSESISMYPHIFGTYLIQMVAIGEGSGNLDNTFTSLSIYFDKESKMRKKLRSAIVYPATLTAVMAAIIVFLVSKILPIFDQMLSSMGGNISPITSIIMSSSKFLNSYALAILGVLVLIIIGFAIYLSTNKGKYNFDKLKAKTPFAKHILYQIVTARFSRSLGILLKSGINLVQAIEQTIPLIENEYLEEKFYVALKKIEEGNGVANTFEDIGIFPLLFIKMVIIGERTGNMDDMLAKSADLFEEQVDEVIERTTKSIEPILISILSIIVGVILLAIMIPMINIMQSI